jgi:hypothetical protein
MGRTRGTVIAIVGSDADDVVRSLGAFPGVDSIVLGDSEDATAADFVNSSSAPYVVHDADPLRHVAAAWVEFFDDRSTLGVLDMEVDAAVSQFASGEAIMPDYYIVVEPTSIEGTWRHWWLGALAKNAPMRVLPVEASSARRAIRSLPTSTPWPQPEGWLPALKFAVPDRVGLPGAA